ncbi:MAG: hypothetical protein KAH23_03595 [Kiritimatiellae bacterium]|nr:hypothetical protein [Kiritimatiellia bacterium]
MDIKTYRVQQIITATALGVIAIIAAGLRILPWPQVFVDGTVRFVANDALYHMHRAFIASTNAMNIPEYDIFMNFPQGFHCNWPPLFDQLIAGTALILGGGNPSPYLVNATGAILPPLLGALTVLAVFFVAKHFMPTPFAILASAVLAILPFHIQISVLGRPDHHVAVVLLYCLILASTLTMARQNSIRKLIANSICTGFLLCLALNIWVGSLLFVVILSLHFLTVFFVNIRKPDIRHKTAMGASILFASCAIFLWPFTANNHWTQVGHMKWDALCHFHLILLLGCAMGFIILNMFFPQHAPSEKKHVLLLRIIAICLTTCFLVFLVLVDFFRPLLAGAEWVMEGDLILKHVMETLPLSWDSAQENFTRIVLLFPLIVIAALYKTWKNGRFEIGILLGLSTLIIGTCTMAKERFSDLFSINAALLIAYCFALILQKTNHQSRVRTIAINLLILVATGYAFQPCAGWFKDYAYSAPRLSHAPLYNLCTWLRENTEPPITNSDDSKTPTYSVLASWHMGNALASIAHRANVANNFLGWKENKEANLQPYRFLTSYNPVEARAILDKHRVRYIIVSEPIISGDLAMMINILGLDPSEFFVQNTDSQRQQHLPAKNTLKTMAVRLYIFNGAELPEFKLVYESKRTIIVMGKTLGIYKIFEYDPMLSKKELNHE